MKIHSSHPRLLGLVLFCITLGCAAGCGDSGNSEAEATQSSTTATVSDPKPQPPPETEEDRAFREYCAAFKKGAEGHEQLGEDFAQYGQSAIPTLKKALTDGSAEVKQLACMLLASNLSLNEHARDVVPELVPLLRDDDEMNRMNTMALLSIVPEPPPELVPFLVEQLDQPQISNVLFALGNLGPHGEAAVPKLRSLLTGDRPTETRQAVIATLERIGLASGPALDDLQKLADNDEEEQSIRDAAKQAADVITAAVETDKKVQADKEAIEKAMEDAQQEAPQNVAVPDLPLLNLEKQ